MQAKLLSALPRPVVRSRHGAGRLSVGTELWEPSRCSSLGGRSGESRRMTSRHHREEPVGGVAVQLRRLLATSRRQFRRPRKPRLGSARWECAQAPHRLRIPRETPSEYQSVVMSRWRRGSGYPAPQRHGSIARKEADALATSKMSPLRDSVGPGGGIPSHTTWVGANAATAVTQGKVAAPTKAISAPFETPIKATRDASTPGWRASQSRARDKTSRGMFSRLTGRLESAGSSPWK